jgi:hypothetical protein
LKVTVRPARIMAHSQISPCAAGLRVVGVMHEEAYVTDLPASPDLSHLRKQAKRLLRDALAGKTPALQRFVEALPAVHGANAAALAGRALQLHDGRSVIAREYGFTSWTELKRYVEWKRLNRAERLKGWLSWSYDGSLPERGLAVRMLREEPEFFSGDAWLGCAIGDEAAIQGALASDPGWVNRPRGAAWHAAPDCGHTFAPGP